MWTVYTIVYFQVYKSKKTVVHAVNDLSLGVPTNQVQISPISCLAISSHDLFCQCIPWYYLPICMGIPSCVWLSPS